MTALPLPARLGGAVWGHLVGDAVGVPYEFRTADQITDVVWGRSGTHHQPAGTWSDDGALMLALLDSLLDAGFDLEDQGRRSLAWFDTGAYGPGAKVFDFGGATSKAMAALRSGTPAVDSGPTGERDCGNGSLTRILPLALVERIAAVVVNEFDPVQVILFGSQARGDSHPGSGFDLVVVMPDGTNRLRTAQAIYRALGKVRGRTRGVDIVVVTSGELERGQDDLGTITQAAHKDGRSRYRRASVAVV